MRGLVRGGELLRYYQCFDALRWPRMKLQDDTPTNADDLLARERAARAAAEEAGARYRMLVESAPDGIVEVDARGRIALTNGETRRMFGYDGEELVGQPVSVLMPERFRQVHVTHLETYARSPSLRAMGSGLELVGRRKDGSEFPVEISLSPTSSGGAAFAMAIIRDISERQRLQEERDRLLLETEAERERARIGMDLHDGIIQSIYAVGLNLEAAADDVAHDPAEAQKRIDQAIEQLNDTIRDIRSYIFELRPTRFSGDIEESLTSLAQEFKVNSLVDTTVEIAPGVPALDDERGLAIFHVALEALTNARKHARATVVRIALDIVGDSVRLEVRDNGVGFDTAARHSDEHNGLRNMPERVLAAGGVFSIESAPGAGTTVRVEMPTGAGM